MFAFCCDILRMGVGGQRHQTIPKIGDVLSDLSNVHAEWPSEYCSYCFCSIHSTNWMAISSEIKTHSIKVSTGKDMLLKSNETHATACHPRHSCWKSVINRRYQINGNHSMNEWIISCSLPRIKSNLPSQHKRMNERKFASELIKPTHAAKHSTCGLNFHSIYDSWNKFKDIRFPSIVYFDFICIGIGWSRITEQSSTLFLI